MIVLIIGLGSIARKHILALRKLNENVSIYALRSGQDKQEEEGIRNIYGFEEIPPHLDFSIVSNPTSKHLEAIQLLIELNKPIFIEKPVFNSLEGISDLLKEVKERNLVTYIGCNLRFHPIIQRLKTEMNTRRPIEISAYCGSYLPDWRPGVDYRDIYSAQQSLGGGVHLDLIHELDYIVFLLGQPKSTQSYRSKKSNLEIDSTDVAHYVLEYVNTSVFITVNYYRRKAKRQIECVWRDETWVADLINGTIQDDNSNIIFTYDLETVDLYAQQLTYFWEAVKTGKPVMNDIFEATQVLRMCLN